MALCSRLYLKRTKPFIIWITWSVWKTSSRMIIYQVLKQFTIDKNIYTSPKNFNSEIWLILSIFKIEKYSPSIWYIVKLCFVILWRSFFGSKNYDILILEYWVDHPKDMDFLLKVAKPNIWVFTKLDNVHVEYFKDINAIWDEKFKLIKNSKDKVYLNFEDNFCKDNYKDLEIDKSYYFWWNIKIKDYDLVIEDEKINAFFKLWNKNIKTNVLWEENSEYIWLAINILKDIDEMVYNNLEDSLFVEINNQPWRFNIFKWINDSVLIDSTYNASPKSMEKMIKNTYLLKEKLFPEYKVWFVLWDLRELWKETEQSHDELKQFINDNDYAITIWPEMYKYLAPNLTSVKSFISSEKAWKQLKIDLINSKGKYIILFKWSQNTIFTEEALKYILKNKKDKKSLVRQDSDWIKIKDAFFKTV